MPKNHQNIQRGERLHIPVLAKEVIDCLQPQAEDSYLDLTAGYGGHAELILQATKSPEKTVLVDRDEAAAKVLENKFPESIVINSDFLGACRKLQTEGKQFNIILADLGVSSPHFDNPDRGFAFSTSGPLDMRMDQRQAQTASQLVNNASEQELARIIKQYGQEPRANAVAKAIVANRPVESTSELARIIEEALGRKFRSKKVHPATLTFQALRIAVNDELNQIEQSLPLMENLLAPGGRLAIISFHSLEDRIVKQFFKDQAGDRYDAELRMLTSKPITAGPEELVLNPRARSAKLRAAAKIKR